MLLPFLLIGLALLLMMFPLVNRDFAVVFLPSSRSDLRRVKERLALSSADMVYDLGCGDGSTLARLVVGSGAHGVGVEISPFWCGLAAWEYRSRKELVFRRESLFTTSISDATIVYCFLIPKIMPRLAKKLKQELRPGTRVVSHLFPIADLGEPEIITNERGNPTVFIYRI